MKIDFNPNAAAQAQNARGPQAQSSPTPPTPEASDDGVEITLSQTAQQALKAGASEYTGNSPAHMARAALAAGEVAFAEGQDAATMPFGQIVKTFTPGHLAKAAAAAEGTETPPAEGGDGTGEIADGSDGTETVPTEGTEDTGGPAEGGADTGVVEAPEETGETGETGDTIIVEGPDEADGGTVVEAPGETDGGTVVEAPDETDPTVVAAGPDETLGSDPAIVVEEPDVTEVLDESVPADAEVGEPESGLAGSGDAVASAGDGESGDGTTPVAPSEPVAVVDGGELTDELLDPLDEGSAETV